MNSGVSIGSPDLVSPFERRVLPSPVFGLNRVCMGFEKRDGCGTVLCRYNPGPLCFCCTRAANYRRQQQLAVAA